MSPNSRLTPSLRVLKPFSQVYAFYAGGVERDKVPPPPTWVDEEYDLGIASYALVADHDALIYDTHVTLAHAAEIRAFVEALGVRRIRVVLSHWHLDHVAGNEVFQDCEIIAHSRTLRHLSAQVAAIEAGTAWGPPPIAPLVLPTTTYDEQVSLAVGRLAVELHHAQIHSDDATVLQIPQIGVLLAGDTLEDTVTYVDEPKAIDTHLSELERLASWGIDTILPSHGDPDVLAGGGYRKTLIRATQQYLDRLQRCVREPALQQVTLQTFVAEQLQAGWINYFVPYEAVHRQNVARVVASSTT